MYPWQSSVAHLPIAQHLSQIAEGVQQHSISLLEAPPGSGKTTVLPLLLAEQPWLAGKKILVLQPRRLAAKGVAQRMAEMLQEGVGEQVGYQIRLDHKVSKRTRIEIITEGLLTRRLISEPELNDVGLVIFDEFHERSIHADIGLALIREVISTLRPDLKVLVMSATLGSLTNHPLFSSAWSYKFTTEPHPLTITYRHPEPRQRVWEYTAHAIKAALLQHEGDLLAFLPGAFEILRCKELLEGARINADVFPLFGDLPYDEQRNALLASPKGRRKVVLATTIAETSLTIEGVRIVVDSGYHKIARIETTGGTSLKTERISRDSADQRAGRAARTDSGVCIRLWSEQEHLTLRATREPEIQRSDLTQTALELAAWGVRDLSRFEWLTAPSTTAAQEAVHILQRLGALDQNGLITERGKALVDIGTHPRLGSLCLEAQKFGVSPVAAAIVAVLEERPSTRTSTHTANIQPLVESLLDGSYRGSSRLSELSERWRRRLEAKPSRDKTTQSLQSEAACGALLAVAFPERIAQRRDPESARYLLASGGGAALREGDPLAKHEFIVVADMQNRGDDGAIALAAPLDERLLSGPLLHLVTRERRTQFNEQRGSLESRDTHSLGAIILREGPLQDVPRMERREALMQYLRTEEGFHRLNLPDSYAAIRDRINWGQTTYADSGFPNLSDHSLREAVSEWLAPFVPEDARLSSITPTIIDTALSTLLPWSLRKELDRLAPESLSLPNGKQRRLRYDSVEGPVLEAMIQELFGLADTPRIGPNKTPVTLHLLSPARRPMQVTRDLRSFWKNGYPLVRKELRGRYPKHRWPEDPLSPN